MQGIKIIDIFRIIIKINFQKIYFDFKKYLNKMK